MAFNKNSISSNLNYLQTSDFIIIINFFNISKDLLIGYIVKFDFMIMIMMRMNFSCLKKHCFIIDY